jgi:hypothetical protein
LEQIAKNPLGLPDDQHAGHGRQSTHSRMGHQALRLGALLRFALDRMRWLSDTPAGPPTTLFSALAVTVCSALRLYLGRRIK